MRAVEIVYRCGSDGHAPREQPADAEAALRRMEAGNHAFAALFSGLDGSGGTAREEIPVDPRDLGVADGGNARPEQRPYAAVLGCADARVPIELVFNEGPNDLFVVRVAGNSLGDDVLASLDYAFDHLGDSLRLVAVLGHSGCGAVTAAVDVFLNPSGYLALPSNLRVRALVDRLQAIVHASSRRMELILGPGVRELPGYRAALIEMAVVTNAAVSAHALQREISASGRRGLWAAYGVYVLSTRAIWAPRCDGSETNGLARPPASEGDFVRLGEAVIRSRRIAGLLGEPTPAATRRA